MRLFVRYVNVHTHLQELQTLPSCLQLHPNYNEEYLIPDQTVTSRFQKSGCQMIKNQLIRYDDYSLIISILVLLSLLTHAVSITMFFFGAQNTTQCTTTPLDETFSNSHMNGCYQSIDVIRDSGRC